MRVEYEDSDETGWRVVVSNPEGISRDDKNSVYLIDHAWTYDTTSAHRMLATVDGLLDRMCSLMEIDTNTTDVETQISQVIEKMWEYNQTYSFAGFEQGSAEASPVWYVLDEFGSRIQHSAEPSVKMVPFFSADKKTAYSVFWPLHDLQLDDEVTRDYIPHIPVDAEFSRLAHLLPWNPCDFMDIDDGVEEPGPEYFKISRFDDVDTIHPRGVTLPKDRQLLVWTNHPVVDKYLTSSKFKLTEDRDEADIIWQLESIKDFKELSERDVMFNQFPYEAIVTSKDLLSIIARRAASPGHSHPRWLPTTYNLNSDLSEFICHFQKREKQGDDNHWIAKPWNLGRGLGHVITKNINCLVRIPECGPYIAMKYLEDPVLYHRPDIGDVKFDYRYEVYLKGVNPLRLTCARRFFIRFANRKYSLDSLHVYDKHFTVQNYDNPKELLNINCEEFIPEFDRQHPQYPWADIETETLQCIKELFLAASSKEPPFGIPRFPQSRAHYAVDIMLKWDRDDKGQRIMVPQILECNFSPDSKRGCQNYNDYYNIAFRALFLDEPVNPEDELVVAS